MGYAGENAPPALSTFVAANMAKAVAELWVDAAAGSDSSGDGTQPNPFQTLDRAYQIALSSTVPTEIHLAAGEYTTELMKKFSCPPGVHIVGDDVVEVVAAMALDAYSAGGVYDFSTAAPGWTDEELSGLELEVVVSSNGAPVGQRRTILRNTADTLRVGYPTCNPAFDVPNPGDTFRIVKPAARIRYASSTTEPKVALIGGRGLTVRGNPFFSDWSEVCWLDNIEIFSDVSVDMYFLGTWFMSGVHFVQEAAANFDIYFYSGSLTSGKYQNSDTDVLNFRRGISVRSEGSVSAMPVFYSAQGSFMYVDCFVGGQLTAYGGQVIELGTCFCDMREVRFPHGALSAVFNGAVWTTGGSGAQQFLKSVENSIAAENNSVVELYGETTHVGNSAFGQAKAHSQLVFEGPIVVEGTNASITSRESSSILMQGFDYSSLGDAIAGTTTPGRVTRSAAPWAAGDIVEGDGACWIARTS